MKRGCLLRSVAYLVLLAAILIYLFDKYGKPIYESSRQRLEEAFIEQLESQILKTTSENLTDSLKSAFEHKVEDIRNSDTILDTNKINDLLSDIKKVIKEQSEEIEDFSKLKEIILEYEQRKKN